jgi:hypothetical protein
MGMGGAASGGGGGGTPLPLSLPLSLPSGPSTVAAAAAAPLPLMMLQLMREHSCSGGGAAIDDLRFCAATPADNKPEGFSYEIARRGSHAPNATELKLSKRLQELYQLQRTTIKGEVKKEERKERQRKKKLVAKRGY